MSSSRTFEMNEFMKNKERELAKLNHEYQVMSESSVTVSDPDSEIKVLNEELYRLMAEVNVLKTSEPEIMPNCDTFLYAWTQHTLMKDIEGLEKIFADQDLVKQESTMKRELLIQKYPDAVCGDVNASVLEEESYKNELLQCLHRKLVRRMRRLSRWFSAPAESGNGNMSSKTGSEELVKKDFYSVLKEFVLELKDRTFSSHDWDRAHTVLVDPTYSKEHIRILHDSGIIQKLNGNPSLYHLRRH